MESGSRYSTGSDVMSLRANIHLGRNCIRNKSNRRAPIAIKATKAMDLKVAGVDIIQSKRTIIIRRIRHQGLKER
jgi:glutathione synthase/RimK-type ligase-like ATP-grasp enzyme